VQVLIPQLGADAQNLLAPPRGVWLRQIDLGAKLANEKIVQVFLVDHVGIERSRSRVERRGNATH
jgi:hypothetical protein